MKMKLALLTSLVAMGITSLAQAETYYTNTPVNPPISGYSSSQTQRPVAVEYSASPTQSPNNRPAYYPTDMHDDYSDMRFHEHHHHHNHYKMVWSPVYHGRIPLNAIVDGFIGTTPIFVCQARYHGRIYTGRVYNSDCRFTWRGKEIFYPYYKVLTEQAI